MKRPPGLPDWIPDSCLVDARDLTSDDPEVHAAAVKRVCDIIVAKVEESRAQDQPPR